MQHLSDLSLRGKRVLMRVDFNVPMDAQGHITEDMRIQAVLPSIHYVLQQEGKLILMSHMGRPNGKKNDRDSLLVCAKRLGEYLESLVHMAPDCVGPEVEYLMKNLSNSSVLLLENLRFHVGEEEPGKEPGFKQRLGALGDVYINEAFAASHRPHTSIVGVPSLFPHRKAAGFLFAKEIEQLSKLRTRPNRPFHMILGGGKVSSKVGVISGLMPHLDALYLGGGMAFPFLRALGKEIGDSLCTDEEVAVAKKILQEAGKVPIYLPLDLVAMQEDRIELFHEELAPGWNGMDIGPKTLEEWSQRLAHARTIFWNGPVGVFEKPPFHEGTYGLAKLLASLAQDRREVVAGGGDSIAAIESTGLGRDFTYLSTGGGATLEFLEFGSLPGIEALSSSV